MTGDSSDDDAMDWGRPLREGRARAAMFSPAQMGVLRPGRPRRAAPDRLPVGRLWAVRREPLPQRAVQLLEGAPGAGLQPRGLELELGLLRLADGHGGAARDGRAG